MLAPARKGADPVGLSGASEPLSKDPAGKDAVGTLHQTLNFSLLLETRLVENPVGVSSDSHADEVPRSQLNVFRSGFPGIQTLIESSRKYHRTRDVTLFA